MEAVMAVSLPYLASNKNVPTIFEKIASAKIPETFTHGFLQNSIGLKSTADRQLIPLLRHLGFINQSGTPSEAYRLLKSNEKKRTAIAAGVRHAYAPLFDSDQDAHTLTGEKLKSLVAQVAGTDDDMTGRIASTFTVLAKLGDFAAESRPADKSKEKDEESKPDPNEARRPTGLRTEFHYNIQVQLPSNGTEETYLNIFNALRKTFQ
jgi:hypothetical protein